MFFYEFLSLLTGTNSVSLSGHPKQSHNVRSSPRCTSLITISMYSSRLVLFDGWCMTTEIPTQPVQSAASLNQWPPLGVSRFAVQKRKKNTFKWANIHRVVIHSLHAGATAVQGLPNLRPCSAHWSILGKTTGKSRRNVLEDQLVIVGKDV